MPGLAPRINFVGSGNEGDRVRGMEYFQVQQEMLPELARVGTNLALETDRCGLYVVLMPGNPGIADKIEHVASLRCGCHTIVDVHADFWQQNDNLPQVTAREVWDWWFDGGHVAVLERAIRAADVITVPSTEYIPSVQQFNPNIVVVPDVSDDESEENAIAVARGWLEAIQISRNHKH